MVKRIILVAFFLLFVVQLVEAATANFIVPFNQTTRKTTLPLDAEGQPIPLDWVHLTLEQGDTVVCQVRGEDAVIAAMKLDPAYCWLEDVGVTETATKPTTEPVIEPTPALDPEPIKMKVAKRSASSNKKARLTAKVDDGAKVKAYLKAKNHKSSTLDKLKWDGADNIIESAVKLHGSTMTKYRGSGLGQ